jgi:hypothetical protein
MAIGSTIAAIGSAAAGGLASAAAGKLFGGSSSGATGSGVPPMPKRILAPGLRLRRTGDGPRAPIEVSRTAETRDLLSRLAQEGGLASGRFGDLLDRVAPGFSQMRSAREGAITSTFGRERSQAIGSLRQNLARRGVLGSSFADSSIGMAQSAFADAEARALAESQAASFLEEIDMTQQLATQDFNISTSVIQAALDQGRFEVTSALNFAAATGQAMSESARLQQELAMANAAGRGAFFQPAIDAFGSAVGDAVGKGVSGLFGSEAA